MRILHAANFDYAKTWADINGILSYRSSLFPIKLEEVHARLIRLGWFTVYGRDKFLRPVVIMKPMVLARSGIPLEPSEIIHMACYASFYVMNFMYKPGLIENNIMIFDLENASAF